MTERLTVAQVFAPMAAGHRARYRWAVRQLCRNDLVNDLGCGVGYGCRHARVEQWRGYDRADVLRDAARAGWAPSRGRLLWVPCDLDAPGFLPKLATATIAFEVLEHVVDPARLAAAIACTTVYDVMVSVPVVPTVGANPYHRHDFTVEDVPPLFPSFAVVDEWDQPDELAHVWRLARR